MAGPDGRRDGTARAPGAVRGGIARDHRSILFGGARRRRIARVVLAAALAAGAAAAFALAAGPTAGDGARAGGGAAPPPAPQRHPASSAPAPEPHPEARDRAPAAGAGEAPPADPPIAWRRSRSLGLPYAGGRLVRGVRLPAEGRHFFTWDPILKRPENRGWRRWGTDRLVRTLLDVAEVFRAAHPAAPRIGVGDLSRPRGGDFGPRFGALGHASHQNGLDADVYYPRRDRRERRPHRPDLVDTELAQTLVDLFVRAGAEKVFVGPRLGLRGPGDVVVALTNHDDHLHVRLPARGR